MIFLLFSSPQFDILRANFVANSGAPQNFTKVSHTEEKDRTISDRGDKFWAPDAFVALYRERCARNARVSKNRDLTPLNLKSCNLLLCYFRKAITRALTQQRTYRSASFIEGRNHLKGINPFTNSQKPGAFDRAPHGFLSSRTQLNPGAIQENNNAVCDSAGPGRI